MEELLILMFIGYLVGWFVSFIIALAGSANSKKGMAIAHGYAILLLLIFSHFAPIEDISLLMLFLSFFNTVAMIFFLYQYQSLYLKEQVKANEMKNLNKEILPNV